MKRLPILVIAIAVVLIFSGLSRAAYFTETEPNDTFAQADNIDSYFSLGAEPDVGNPTDYGLGKSPDPQIIPWVSITGSGDNTIDYFSFTVTDDSWFWMDLDYGYIPDTQNYDSQLILYKYNPSTSSYEYPYLGSGGNDLAYYYGGTGSVSAYGNGDDTSLDAYWRAKIGAGFYVLGVMNYSAGPVPNDVHYKVQVSLENPVPIPGAIWLLGSGLIGIVGIKKKFKK